jgi:hypothetical protein
MTSTIHVLLQQAVAGKSAQDFVLTRKSGKPIKNFRKVWRDLTTRAGIPGPLVHDLRRSAAKAMNAAGVPESVVMEMGVGRLQTCSVAMPSLAKRTVERQWRSLASPRKQLRFRPLFRKMYCSPSFRNGRYNPVKLYETNGLSSGAGTRVEPR